MGVVNMVFDERITSLTLHSHDHCMNLTAQTQPCAYYSSLTHKHIGWMDLSCPRLEAQTHNGTFRTGRCISLNYKFWSSGRLPCMLAHKIKQCYPAARPSTLGLQSRPHTYCSPALVVQGIHHRNTREARSPDSTKERESFQFGCDAYIPSPLGSPRCLGRLGSSISSMPPSRPPRYDIKLLPDYQIYQAVPSRHTCASLAFSVRPPQLRRLIIARACLVF